MTLLHRCSHCRRPIWPWQHYGFITGRAEWHTGCRAGYFGSSVEEVLLWLDPDSPLTLADVQRLLDEASA